MIDSEQTSCLICGYPLFTGEHGPHPANKSAEKRQDAVEQKDGLGDALEANRLHHLLLTPEEERTIRQSNGEPGELKKRSKNGAEIVVRGIFEHMTEAVDAVEVMKPHIDALTQEDPDIVLIEGGLSLEDFYPGESPSEIMEKDPVQVLKERGEQAYIAFLATREGKDVRTWDTMNLTEQIRFVIDMKDETSGENKWRPEEVTEWFVNYASRMAYTSGKKKATPDEIRIRANWVLTPDGVKKAASWGIELTDENIEAALQKHIGRSSKELAERFENPVTRQEDEAKLIEMTEPQFADERMVTREVLRDMNIERDKRAVGIFREVQKQHPGKKLFVTAGASHLTVWRPAIEELYKQ